MLHGTNIIKKSNELNQSYYKLKEVTQRVLAVAVEQAQDIEKQTGENLILNGTKVIICADYYAKIYDVDLNTAYDALRAAVKDMYHAEYVWEKIGSKGKFNQYRTRFVSHIGYLNGEAAIEFVLTEMARQHIYNQTRNFTMYEIKQLKSLGKYSIRLYELLVQWRSTGKVTYDLEEFRLKLGVDPTEYNHISNFKKRVLDFSINEINKYTYITVSYDQNKAGRNITGFTFTFKQKKTKVVEMGSARDPDTVDMFHDMTDAQIHTFGNQLARLHDLGYLATAGESYDNLAVRIKAMLKDPEAQKQFHPYLKQLGFSPKGGKS